MTEVEYMNLSLEAMPFGPLLNNPTAKQLLESSLPAGCPIPPSTIYENGESLLAALAHNTRVINENGALVMIFDKDGFVETLFTGGHIFKIAEGLVHTCMHPDVVLKIDGKRVPRPAPPDKEKA